MSDVPGHVRRNREEWTSWAPDYAAEAPAAWAGARPVGVDITPAQLETARAMQERFGLEFPLVEANDACRSTAADACRSTAAGAPGPTAAPRKAP